VTAADSSIREAENRSAANVPRRLRCKGGRPSVTAGRACHFQGPLLPTDRCNFVCLSEFLFVCLFGCLSVCLFVCLSVARCTLSAALLHAAWQGADVLWAGLPLITLARETVLAAPSVLTRYSHGTQGVIKERDGTDCRETACDVPKLDRAHSLHGAAGRTMRHPRSSASCTIAARRSPLGCRALVPAAVAGGGVAGDRSRHA
jgi:hypothetical protein